jgi:hypothetical protein
MALRMSLANYYVVMSSVRNVLSAGLTSIELARCVALTTEKNYAMVIMKMMGTLSM